MMNGRHLPAGQGMPPDLGRRRPYNQHHNHNHTHNPMQHQQQYAPQGPVYNPYMNPYNAAYYPQQYAPQYPNAPMPHQYGPYPPYVRSPPPMQHYAPAPMPQQPLPYTRPQPSPIVSTPYQPPPPHTPSSTHSSHTVSAPLTPPTPQAAVSIATSSPAPEETTRIPFRAPLPWLSRPELCWPSRRPRRKRKPTQHLSAQPVELPVIQQGTLAEAEEKSPEDIIARPETPSTNHPASEENDSTNPTTPSSAQKQNVAGDTTPVAPKTSQRANGPAVPVIPLLQKSSSRAAVKAVSEIGAHGGEILQGSMHVSNQESSEAILSDGTMEEEKVEGPAIKAWTTPKLWTGLFNPAIVASGTSNEAGQTPALGKTNAESFAEALRSFNAVSNDSKVAFLEPRGLVNTGNMCYMNSVLQVLVFCGPFYNFLEQAGQRAVHSFKSDTPLVEAMIMFMREFSIIDSATSVDQLKRRLKDGELEQYGESFTPDFVYEVINRLPRFSSMRRGHQQDAEEFLGFLLEGLHDECVRVMQASASRSTSAIPTPTNVPSSPTSDVASGPASSVGNSDPGWLEVGPKQKAAVTRSSGTITTGSPVTKIFGGNLRSELRVPGLKDSVTLEPYQPLQLDIGAPNVNNIVDALKGLTRSETLHGDFKSPKGPNVSATKQVFIETLPPVLILHLKRFQYDNAGGTQKIWKKVGYPLELEIPKEVFPRQKRSVYAHGGLPRYRLIAVVYHHGKNASGGHYTVDVRRQDGREWIRLDDTVIRRVRSEDVAEGGNEEDPKSLSTPHDEHKRDNSSSGNTFAAIDADEHANDNGGWKQASGPGKKWSSVVNGASTPKSKNDKFSVKDNKVAYLLFYQKI